MKWTLEELQAEALKYKSKSEFRKNSSAYGIASKRGIISLICSHMPIYKNRSGKNSPCFKWTNEALALEALKYKTRNEFKKGSFKAWKTASGRGMIDEICVHMEYVNRYWTNEELHKEALKYNSIKEFRKIAAYSTATARGMLDTVCSHMSYVYKDWSNDNLKTIAFKYKTKADFRNGDLLAYQAASRRNMLDEICSHMDEIYHRWTNEELGKEALKYDTKIDFRKESKAAYSCATKRGILDEICSHMKNKAGSSRPEREIFAIIKSIFPSAKKLRDRNINIEDRYYIYGFDIDIFVPELGLGIEYDGKRHHSFEYMRKDKSKKNWPDEAIQNYHQIKDAHFLSKGIKILHIKEENWNKDGQACIYKCLEFLGITKRNVA